MKKNISKVCQRCGSINIDIKTKSDKEYVITILTCRDCTETMMFKEYLMPRQFKKEEIMRKKRERGELVYDEMEKHSRTERL